jgi:hypothetical protein
MAPTAVLRSWIVVARAGWAVRAAVVAAVTAKVPPAKVKIAMRFMDFLVESVLNGAPSTAL